MLQEVVHLGPRFLKHPAATVIIQKVKKALPYFPEIPEVLLRRGGHKHGMQAWANADPRTLTLKFNVECIPSMNTVFHELGHLVHPRVSGWPSGEEACSIFALARMPHELEDSCLIPYIGLVPFGYVSFYCNWAILRRNKGERQYIKWLKKRLKKDKERIPSWPQSDVYEEMIAKRSIEDLLALGIGRQSELFPEKDI